MVTSISHNIGISGLHGILRASQKQEGETPEAAVSETLTTQTLDIVAAHTVPTQASSLDMMSRNFASAERQESRYVQGTLAGLKADAQMNSQQRNAVSSILHAAQIAYQNATTSGEKAKALSRAEQMISLNRQSEVEKDAEETHLKESREAIEAKAREALAPTDANGNPLQGIPVAVPEEATPMPETSSPAPAPVTETAPAVSAPVAPAPEVSPSITSIQTVDISV